MTMFHLKKNRQGGAITISDALYYAVNFMMTDGQGIEFRNAMCNLEEDDAIVIIIQKKKKGKEKK